MRITRIDTPERVVTGINQDGVVETEDAEYVLDNEDTTLLAPCEPSVFYCVGANYPDYVEGTEMEYEEHLHWFIKPPVSLHDPEASIPYPGFTDELGCAAELAAVVGEKGSQVSLTEAKEIVRGFTIMNDLDAVDQPEVSSRKAFDAAAPLGPWIETELDPTNLDMQTKINGELGQEANTGEMIWGPWEIIMELSNRVTLMPGDVIAFGSPGSPGQIGPGDEIEMWYEGIGTLRNIVEPE